MIQALLTLALLQACAAGLLAFGLLLVRWLR